MGQEIDTARFSEADFAAFEERLQAETALLERWIQDGVLANTGRVGGFELEAWLVDADLNPAPLIEPFLTRMDDPLVVTELATFNTELNGTPRPLRGDALSRLAAELEGTWARCNRVAAGLGARLAMIGILPTVRPEHLDLSYMTQRKRYLALNEQILRLRQGRPLTLDIRGEDHLCVEHRDVMLEAAATSFQIHLQVPATAAARVYNSAKILSAPMVAIAANSPFLFGRKLWDETRIPLFEQAVSVGGSVAAERVNFGIRYAHASIIECFRANLSRYPVLLPQAMDRPAEDLAHLRLHNGTIWRWNRPLIGFDGKGAPHVRIEHRPIPAGPTVADAIANAALYFGAVHSLVQDAQPPEQRLPFPLARENFYTAARAGLGAEIHWLAGRRLPVVEVLRQDLLPRARRGLLELGIEAAEADLWLGIVAERLRTGQNGATWQRAYLARHGADMRALTGAYLERQQGGQPVHEWTL